MAARERYPAPEGSMRGASGGSQGRAIHVFAVALGLAAALLGGPALGETLRVGTSGDYPPFSARDEDGAYSGFSIELARGYARDRGLELELVDFAWPRLLGDLAADRFDVAISGITVRPERSARAIFSVPTATSGAVVLVKPETWTDVEQLDTPRIRIGVNAGGHLERVAAQHFPRATRVSIPDNASVPVALADDAIQAAVTDSAEAPIWLERFPKLVVLGPITRDRKAMLVRSERPELAADLDRWLMEREQDGTLAKLRAEQLGGPAQPAVALPLAALLAALDERLSLMPLVAVVKRASGVPLEVPEREQIVIESAAESVLEAASRRERVPPSFLLIQRFFRAQMEAAKQIQRDTVTDPDFALGEDPPDLDADLRPALLHIGNRISRLIVELPPLAPAAVHAAAREELRAPKLSRSSAREIEEALALLPPKGP
jgi:cyclohexadienyl dehydratase